ncbi:MAG TPA: flavodoxin family protein [Tissierellia bacterium]|nr:flavodoxin family protein [Tissierellia bacterium]
MKVLLINGSPNEKGCTYTALNEISNELIKNGIETEIFHIGNKPIGGCIACGKCEELKKCVFEDAVNIALKKAMDADGFVFGTPVYFGSPNGSMISFMDRLFKIGNFAHKPAAVVASARRGGTTASLDVLLKYPAYMQMPIISADYWNMVHGNTPEEVMQDKEGIHTMRVIGRNMAWLLKCIEAGKSKGIFPDRSLKEVWTNFIR